jgi:small subunit ribosomal protein S20
MAHSRSARKNARQAVTREARNIAARSVIKTFKRKLTDAVTKGDSATAEKAYRELSSVLDKTAKKGVIKRNNAIRKKQRAAGLLKKIAAPKA